MTISTNQLQTNSLVSPSNPTSFAPILNDLRSIIAEINGTPSYTPPYKSYVAAMSQAGTAIPTSAIILNELSGTPIWSRVGIGVYQLALSSAFPLDKTFVNNMADAALGVVYIGKLSSSVIEFVFSNDIVSNYVFEIRVYN